MKETNAWESKRGEVLYCGWVTKRVIRPAQLQEWVVGTKKRNIHLWPP